jgi:signal transduction histidine kinase
MLPHTGSKKYLYIFRSLVAAISIIGLLSSYLVGSTIYHTNKNHLMDRAQTIAQAIPPQVIRMLAGDQSDLTNEAYIGLKLLLTSIREVNSDLEFVYLNGLRNGEVFFYVDSEEPESEDYSRPGEPYPEASVLMRSAFANNISVFEMERDHWGFWASALAPIVDEETGEVVALAGIDASGKEFIIDMLSYGAVPLLVAGILLSLIIATQRLRTKEREELDQKAEFLFVASHEIRMPLTGMRWAADRMLTDKVKPLDEAHQKILTLIHENSTNLINTVNNLLTVNTFERGKKSVELHKETIAIKPVIQQIVRNLNLTALEHNVVLYINESFPEDVMIDCDIEQMRHVLVNLVSNAIKYTNANTDVVINYSKENGKHKISIVDHGNGLTEEELKHIFDGYHRTNEARRGDQMGTGLGLYLSKKIANLHGGDIVVESKRGQGSTFSVVV